MTKHTSSWSYVLLALSALTISALPTRRGHGHEDPPVCIIGAGPAGLSAAARLVDKGIKAVVFDKQDQIGGKSQVYYDEQGIFHPLGAAFFSNATYPETVKILNQTSVTIEPFAIVGSREIFRYNYSTCNIEENPALTPLLRAQVSAEIPRYIALWNQRFRPISAVNYKLGVPDEFTVSAADWFRQNNFTALPLILVNPISWYGYGDINIVPALYILQYMTPDVLTAYVGLHGVYYMDFNKMFVEYREKKLCDVPFHLSAEVRCVDRSGKRPVVSYTEPHGNYVKWQKQECASVIFAFPPSIENLERAGVDLTELEYDTFHNVTTHQYYSSADEFALPYGVSYVANGTSPTEPPPNDGQMIATLHLDKASNISVAWQWGPYEYQTEEVGRELLIESMGKVNKDPRIATESPAPFTDDNIKAFMKWDYFPHFESDALRSGAYAKLNLLQGQKKSYWASGLSGMEIVEWAIRGGYEVVDSYF